MSRKSQHIATFTTQSGSGAFDPHYLAYFHCFNRQLFYEAHDALEELWLVDRHGPDGDFYKGLIQLAGAFVHAQKNRSGPAGALLRLARAHLEKYPPIHLQLDRAAVCALIANWSLQLESSPVNVGRLVIETPPTLALFEVGARVPVEPEQGRKARRGISSRSAK